MLWALYKPWYISPTLDSEALGSVPADMSGDVIVTASEWNQDSTSCRGLATLQASRYQAEQMQLSQLASLLSRAPLTAASQTSRPLKIPNMFPYTVPAASHIFPITSGEILTPMEWVNGKKLPGTLVGPEFYPAPVRFRLFSLGISSYAHSGYCITFRSWLDRTMCRLTQAAQSRSSFSGS